MNLKREFALLAAVLAVNAPASELQPEGSSPAGQYVGEPLSLNFQDVEVRSALQIIADIAGLNLVAPDSVSGRITLRLVDVPWDEALHLVLAVEGLGKRQTGNVLMVAPAEEIIATEKAELENRKAMADLAPLATEFIRIRYADAAALAALLTGEGVELALSERGRALVDERTNSLLLTDTAANLANIKNMIASLDIPVRQVQIEARIVNANSNFSEQFGIRWGVELRSGGPTTTPSGIEESTGEEEASDGMRAKVGAVSAGGTIVSAEAEAAAYWLDMELSASVAAGEAEVIARPKVVTTNKQPATIESGVEIPYQQATKSGATSITFKDAVLQLHVTPRITPNAQIVMDLEVKQDTVGRVYHGVPSINTTRIVTQVLVDDGDTVVLGGIFQTDKLQTVARTPLLGNLPVIGRAFRRTEERDDKQELFIFITPQVVPEVAAASAASKGA